MSELYYKPELEEFYIGFEFQLIDKHNVTVNKVFGRNQDILYKRHLEQVIELLKTNRIRVKYLDNADIESFGFTRLNENTLYTLEANGIEYYLVDYPAIPHKYEIRPSHPSMRYGSFLGFIKNKSDLGKILKQLDILK